LTILANLQKVLDFCQSDGRKQLFWFFSGWLLWVGKKPNVLFVRWVSQWGTTCLYHSCRIYRLSTTCPFFNFMSYICLIWHIYDMF